MKTLQIIFSSLLLTCHAYGTEEKFWGTELAPSFELLAEQSQHYANFQALPSTIINGCVNVITGDYIEKTSDLATPGTAAFDFQRFYSSGDCQYGSLQYGWQLNHGGKLLQQQKEQITLSFLKGTGRNGVHYQGALESNAFTVSNIFLTKGIINCVNGLMGAHTNIRNDVLHSSGNELNLILANGTNYLLSLDLRDREASENFRIKSFPLKKASYPNGISYSYYYKPAYGFLSQLEVNNRKGDKVTGLKLIKIRANKEASIEPVAVKLTYCSEWDSRKVTYQFKLFGDLKGKTRGIDGTRAILEHVSSSDVPSIHYSYEDVRNHSTWQRLVRKEMPNHRFLGISYYPSGEFLKDKVAFLTEPAGIDADPVTTWNFHYMNQSGNCTARVQDALGKTILFHWKSIEQRVREIEYFSDEKQLALKERLSWNDVQHGNPSYLVCHIWEDAKGNLQAGRYFEYDAVGNVSSELFFGNLTGHLASPKAEMNFPFPKNAEVYRKNFQYDAINRLVFEEDGNISYKYSYFDASDLISAKFTCYSGRIQIREFYEYDDSASPILEIVDDGSSQDRNDLADVTERKIKRIRNTLTGLPVEVTETALDLTTGEEKQLYRRGNRYSRYGRLVLQEILDSQNNFSHYLHWQYDSFGNIISERDPLGHETFRHFDNNGNLCSESFTADVATRNFVYDYMNRLIREDLLSPDGAMLTKRYSYDLMGNRLSSTDHYGNQTHYSYDSLGHLIETTYPSVKDENGVWFTPTITQKCDGMGRVTSFTDGKGETTVTTYNARGRPLSILYPDGTEEIYIYTLDGQPEVFMARDGSYMRFSYDSQRRNIQTQWHDPTGQLKNSNYKIYNAFHLIEEKDCEGITSHYTYDFAGRLSSIDCNKHKTEYNYDTLGRVSSVHELREDGGAATTFTSYDQKNHIVCMRRIESSGFESEKKECVYDSQGRCIKETITTPETQRISKTGFDSFGRVISILDSEGKETKKRYGKLLNENNSFVAFEETLDSEGNRTIDIFDTLGRLVLKKCFNERGVLISSQSWPSTIPQ